MIRGNSINKIFRGCSDHWDQLFCLFELKKSFFGLRHGVLDGEGIFSMGMSLAVWLVRLC